MLKAISKLDFKSPKLRAAALKATTLKANKKPQANPTKVDLDNKFLKIALRSLVENINTPIVALISVIRKYIVRTAFKNAESFPSSQTLTS